MTTWRTDSRRADRATHHWDRETALVAQLAACVSFISFVYYFQHGGLLLYGDAVAHINIARRVFDSRTPGLLQLGTVWLPLPHVLMIPFLVFDSAWQSGIGGSLPSMVAYCLGTAGMFRLVRGILGSSSAPDIPARIAAWLGAIAYAANPNLIYLQTTAMTESLYLALFVWAVVFFTEFVKDSQGNVAEASSSLMNCGYCLLGASLTRYDGWLLAAVTEVAGCVVVLRLKHNGQALRLPLVRFLLVAAAAPVFWLAYNAIIYRNPLEFANGPYSARAIEQKNAIPGFPSHPGSHNAPAAFSYFVKSAELNMAEGSLQKLWVTLLFLGSLVMFFDRRLWPAFLLGVPLLFYTLSVTYGGVPIFLPVWWPFSYYNVRYGLQLLPAFCAAMAIATGFALRRAQNKIAKAALVLAPVVLIGASYASVWRAQAVCFREAWANSRTRIALETQLAAELRKFNHDAAFLMYLGDHVGALQQAGIPLRRTVNEGNHRPWKTPTDSKGLWEQALAKPSVYVDFVIAIDGDPVALGVQRNNLKSMLVIHAPGQPTVEIYWTHLHSL